MNYLFPYLARESSNTWLFHLPINLVHNWNLPILINLFLCTLALIFLHLKSLRELEEGVSCGWLKEFEIGFFICLLACNYGNDQFNVLLNLKILLLMINWEIDPCIFYENHVYEDNYHMIFLDHMQTYNIILKLW